MLQAEQQEKLASAAASAVPAHEPQKEVLGSAPPLEAAPTGNETGPGGAPAGRPYHSVQRWQLEGSSVILCHFAV